MRVGDLALTCVYGGPRAGEWRGRRETRRKKVSATLIVFVASEDGVGGSRHADALLSVTENTQPFSIAKHQKNDDVFDADWRMISIFVLAEVNCSVKFYCSYVKRSRVGFHRRVYS